MTDIPDISYIDKKSININFSEFFGLDTEDHNEFSLSRKRSFGSEKMLIKITDSLRSAFEYNEAIILFYLNIAHKINKLQEKYEVEDIIDDLADLAYYTADAADAEIKKTYIPQPEQKRKSTNIELQFTDEHSQIILRASFIVKVIIPLITNYMAVNKIRKNENLFMDSFYYAFKAVDKENINIYNKIYKIVESRIKGTKYSDRALWNLLGYMAENATTTANEHYRKLIIDLVPKLDHDRSVVSFLHVSLKNWMHFKLRTNFPISYSPQNLQEVSDSSQDKLTNLERLEFHLKRMDEAESFVTRSKLYNLIVNVLKDPIIKISTEELEYYKKMVQINSLQKNLLFLYFTKKVGRYRALYNLRFGEYITLLIYFKKWLAKNGYMYLSKWMTTTFPSGLEKPRKVINTRSFQEDLFKSKSFRFLHDRKYRYIMTHITKHNILASIITTLYSNHSVYVANYNEMLADEEVDPDQLNNRSIKHISDEVLRLIETL